MKSFVDDFKYAWNKPNNTLARLIIINVAVFATVNLLAVFGALFNFSATAELIASYLYLPPFATDFILKPWTIVTYFFTHEGFMHILFNMLILYWFGMIFDEFLGSRRLLALYALGGLAGGALYLILFNLVPYFIDRAPTLGMIGASASVYAIVVGAATQTPDYRIHLLFFGPVKIKYIAAVYIFISFVSLNGGNAGGNVAHLGGALMGYLFVTQLGKGNDWGKPILKTIDFFANISKPKPKIKVTYKKETAYAGGKSRGYQKSAAQKSTALDQDVIDAILDKISESGYDKLTKEEKHILFKASQNKKQ